MIRAETKLSSPGVDRWANAEVRFDDGRTGSITCALFSRTLLRIRARVEGDLGTMDVFNPVAPQVYHHLTVETRSGKRRERVDRIPSYTYQLRAFAGATLRGEPVPTGADDAVKNMRVIDAVYRAAGLPRRGAGASPRCSTMGGTPKPPLRAASDRGPALGGRAPAHPGRRGELLQGGGDHLAHVVGEDELHRLAGSNT